MSDSDEELPERALSRYCSVLLDSPDVNSEVWKDVSSSLRLERQEISKPSLEDDENMNIVEEISLNSVKFPKGTLLWASISPKSAFWPSILVEDIDINPEKDASNYHVRFFGDSGRSGWISRQNLMEFKGRDEFEAVKQVEMQKKTPLKAKGRYLVSKKMIKHWETGVCEAEEFLSIPIEDRMEKYTKLIEEQRAILKETLKKRKRERKDSESNVRKKFKFDLSLEDPHCFPPGGRNVVGRKKSSEQSESGISTMGSVSPCPTYDLSSVGTVTPIRVTPEPTEVASLPKKTMTTDEYFTIIQTKMKQDITLLLRKKQKREVCRFCGRSVGVLVRCSGPCEEVFHQNCQDIQVNLSNKVLSTEEVSTIQESPAVCCECSNITVKKCFICRLELTLENSTKCLEKHCSRWYHRQCLEERSQSKIIYSKSDEKKITKITCPQHVCHICSADDLQQTIERRSKLLKCILCPSAFHMQPKCLPAGVELLSGSHLICNKHWPVQQKHVNVNWCFICAKGGTLLCCDNCPSAVHEDCANANCASDQAYICDDCESGRNILYGDIVWAKQGGHRWWPAVTLTDSCIPVSVENSSHNRGDICTYFLGSHDYAWLPRKRMFLYQDDDKDKTHYKARARAYRVGLDEANRLFQVLEQEKRQIKQERQNKMLPPSYKKISKSQLIPPVKRKDIKIDQVTADNPEYFCTCSASNENCGPFSSCVNRTLQIECTNKICTLGQDCQNRNFERQLYPMTKIVRTERCGWGVVTEQPLYEREFVCEYIGEIINEKEVTRRIKFKRETRNNSGYYFLTLANGFTIDAEHKGNVSRFINHSCDPNCETQKWTVDGVTRIGIFATKDIPEGTELTFDYQWEKRDSIGMTCFCGAPHCSGSLG